MVAGLALLGTLGALSILPPYVGPPLGLELNVASDVEVVDHVVPGLTIVICAFSALVLLRSGRTTADSFALALAVGVALLAAVWEVSSHAPLVLDAGGPDTPWGTVLFHAVPGWVVAGAALAVLLRVLSAEPASDQRA